ncbi:MAG: hypothetical protein IPK16_28320 [Anaerolineales bacterium]|nr:hypothetical protein [Anaerolineales bacterium]
MDEPSHPHHRPLARQALRTPRAAAVAGILFAVLFTISVGLMRLAIPENIARADAYTWLQTNAGTVQFALMLMPFAGIAFLWFIGVIRDRLGAHEDQFLSTVFFGSGLLFLAMVFSSAAVAGGMVSAYALDRETLETSGVFTFGRFVIYTITNVYAIRMAGVFMLSLGTIWMRTRVMPRFLVFLTYILAIVLLVVINMTAWVMLVFPLWVFVISVFILFVSVRGDGEHAK